MTIGLLVMNYKLWSSRARLSRPPWPALFLLSNNPSSELIGTNSEKNQFDLCRSVPNLGQGKGGKNSFQAELGFVRVAESGRF